jgi:anthranilate phosphoribosyltransferase
MFHELSPLLGKVRRRLGSPTIFNNLGPLSNPSGAPYQLLGVSRRDMFDKTAAACSRLGTTRTWIVHADGDMDEISNSGPTSVAEVSGETVKFFELTPENFGFKRSAVERGDSMTPPDSARHIGEILNNRRTDDEAENLVLINAGAALRLAGIADSLPAAVGIARESLRSGSAAVKLAELVRESHK